MISGFNVFVLFLAFGAQVLYRRSFRFSRFLFWQKFGEVIFKKSLKLLWILAGAFILIIFLRDSFLQYQAWLEGPMRFALPPYRSLAYFFSYIGTRFLSPWLLSFVVSFIISRLAKWLNRRFEGRFFEEEEIDLIALGVFLSGYPGFLVYLVAILVLGVLIALIYTLFSLGKLPLYFFWLPLAIFVIILMDWIIPKIGFESFFGQFILGDFAGLIFGPIK